MAKIKLDGWQCDRCGHKWAPRHEGDAAPRVCPKCKSPYWNKPYQSEAFKAAGEAKRNSTPASKGKKK